MPTYATAAELAAYAAGTGYSDRLPDGDEARDRLLELAELDLDANAFPVLPVNDTSGARKLAPTSAYSSSEREALSRGTCAQAVYRIEMGDEHFVRAQRQRVQGRGFSKEGPLPIVGPQATRELASAGLLRLTTTVGRRRDGDTFQSDP